MQIKKIIETAWNNIQNGIDSESEQAIKKALSSLNKGEIKICEKNNGEWIINDWLRKAIVLFIRFTAADIMEGNYYDKIPLKFSSWNLRDFESTKIRAVPGAIVRYGSFLSNNVVVMPSFINVGAYVGENTMIDIHATLGSCCYIGKNCHIGANSVIGGVLEPLHDKPVIVEDNVFIGASCSITSGVIVRSGAVIAPGTHISQSTRIYDAISDKIFYGIIPENAVVISGTMPRNNVSIACAIIVKYADFNTRSKVGINELLR